MQTSSVKPIPFTRQKSHFTTRHEICKYFPKYLKTLDINWTGPTRLKLKCIKIVSKPVFNQLTQLKAIYLLLTLFQNKRKSVTYLPSSNCKPYLEQYFQNLLHLTVNLREKGSQRAFLKALKTQRLQLVYKNVFCEKEVLQHQQWHFWHHLNQLKCLKYLEISMAGLFVEHMLLLIKKLNENLNIPSILKVEFIFYGKTSLPQNINSHHILQFQKFFAKITHFTVNEDLYQTFADRWCLSNPNSFENLHSLSVTKRNKGADPLPLEHLSTSFAHFTKLQNIHLSLEFYSSRITFQDFLQDFSLPRSIASVSLKLIGLSWQSLIPDITLNEVINPFENQQLCQHFYKKWTSLSKLKFLAVYFADINKPFISAFYFFAPLLKYLNQLQTLLYSNRYRYSLQKKKPIDFSQFWNYLKHLAPTLEELNIQDFAISFQNFNPSLDDVLRMPNFKNLYIDGFILELDKNFKSLLQVFQNLSIGPKNLNIQSIVVQEAQNSLFNLLQSLSRYSITSSLVLDARKIDSETVVSNLLNFLSQNKTLPWTNLIIENAQGFHKSLKTKLLKALQNQPKIISSLEITSPSGITKLIYGTQFSDMDNEPSLLEWEDDENNSESEISSDGEIENSDFDQIDLS